jgi:hypothetical protein
VLEQLWNLRCVLKQYALSVLNMTTALFAMFISVNFQLLYNFQNLQHNFLWVVETNSNYFNNSKYILSTAPLWRKSWNNLPPIRQSSFTSFSLLWCAHDGRAVTYRGRSYPDGPDNAHIPVAKIKPFTHTTHLYWLLLMNVHKYVYTYNHKRMNLTTGNYF